jgi:hypothetical protein
MDRAKNDDPHSGYFVAFPKDTGVFLKRPRPGTGTMQQFFNLSGLDAVKQAATKQPGYQFSHFFPFFSPFCCKNNRPGHTIDISFIQQCQERLCQERLSENRRFSDNAHGEWRFIMTEMFCYQCEQTAAGKGGARTQSLMLDGGYAYHALLLGITCAEVTEVFGNG